MRSFSSIKARRLFIVLLMVLVQLRLFCSQTIASNDISAFDQLRSVCTNGERVLVTQVVRCFSSPLSGRNHHSSGKSALLLEIAPPVMLGSISISCCCYIVHWMEPDAPKSARQSYQRHLQAISFVPQPQWNERFKQGG